MKQPPLDGAAAGAATAAGGLDGGKRGGRRRKARSSADVPAAYPPAASSLSFTAATTTMSLGDAHHGGGMDQEEASRGEDEGGDASIRFGRGRKLHQHSVLPSTEPTKQQQNPAEDEAVPIALPRSILRRVLNSLFDSGLEQQQALACNLALEINAQLAAMKKEQHHQQQQKKETAAVAGANVGGRRRAVSSLATSSSPSPSPSSSSSSSSSLVSASTTAEPAAAPAIGASSTATAAKTGAPVVDAAPAAPSSPSSLSASSLGEDDGAFLLSSCTGSSSSRSGSSSSEAEAEAEEGREQGSLPALSAERRGWQQRRAGGRRARRSGLLGPRKRAETKDTIAAAAVASAAGEEAEAGQAKLCGVGPGPGPLPLTVTVAGTAVARDTLTGRQYVQYLLRVAQGPRAVEVRRRFSEVLDLDAALSFEAAYDRELGSLVPPRPWLFSFSSALDPHLTQQRAAAIQAYLAAVLARKPLRVHPAVQAFLGFSLRPRAAGRA